MINSAVRTDIRTILCFKEIVEYPKYVRKENETPTTSRIRIKKTDNTSKNPRNSKSERFIG
jgi:hypothetical protein